MKRYTVAVVDANNLARRSMHAHELNAASQMLTQVPFGVVHQFLKLRRDFARSVVFAWDAGRTHRTKLSADYKANRQYDEEIERSFKEQVDSTRRILTAMGVKQVRIPGEEADDAITTLARWHSRKGHRVLVVSNDYDFLQLIDPHVHLLRAEKGVDLVYDEARFRAGYALDRPAQWVDVMSLCGDKGDNVHGVPKIGETSAMAIVRAYPGLVDALINADDHQAGSIINDTKGVPTRIKNLALKAHAAQSTVQKARSLTELSELFELADFETSHVTPDTKKLRTLFVMLGFRSFLDAQSWAELNGTIQRHYVEQRWLDLGLKMREPWSWPAPRAA